MNITLATIMIVVGTIDQHYTTHTCTYRTAVNFGWKIFWWIAENMLEFTLVVEP